MAEVLVGNTLRQRGVRVGLNAVITARRGQLEQVLNNLIGNAIKYSPDGGPIEMEVRPAVEEVTLTVRDRDSLNDPHASHTKIARGDWGSSGSFS